MKQKEKVKELIKNDCKVKGYYKHFETGETCAIGCLAEAAGFDLDFALEHDVDFNSVVIDGRLGPVSLMASFIYVTFGLTKGQQRQIQLLNDNEKNNTPELRRVAILEYIETLTEEV